MKIEKGKPYRLKADEARSYGIYSPENKLTCVEVRSTHSVFVLKPGGQRWIFPNDQVENFVQ